MGLTRTFSSSSLETQNIAYQQSRLFVASHSQKAFCIGYSKAVIRHSSSRHLIMFCFQKEQSALPHPVTVDQGSLAQPFHSLHYTILFVVYQAAS